jgi:antibiotic biosynthesis monooxygenase (ABM) superfamily enzyme
MIRMLVVARVRADKRVEFLQAMDALNQVNGRRPYCGNFTISPSANEPNLFKLAFEWETDEGFEHCLDSEEFSVFLGAIRVLCEEATFASDSQSIKWARIPGMQIEPLRTEMAPRSNPTREMKERD